jgi:hypothetical protein
VLIETFIRKQLRLKAHTVTSVEASEACMLVHIDRLGQRLLAILPNPPKRYCQRRVA